MAEVGASVPRLDAREKASGRAVYVEDLHRPGMLHAAYLLSPYPHARIRRMDISAARAVEGVHAIVTGADFPHRYGLFVKDETALAKEVVRYAGEPVAAVAADDVETARRAAALIEVDYEELPAVTSAEEALAPGAPLVHGEFGAYERRFRGAMAPNVCAETSFAEGDVEKALASADVVVEATYETPAQVHCYMEPCGALAELDDAGRLVIWSPCHAVHRVQAGTAEALGIPMSKVRAVLTRVGGAFGGKTDTTVQPVAALLALRTRRPVKLVLSRSDDFAMMRTRHPAKVRMRLGARRDGTLTAMDVELVMDGGAYCEDSPAVMGYALTAARGPYRIANVRSHGRAVYTHRLRAAGFRGYGNPQVTFARESLLDELAAKLDLDPLELRTKNAMVAGDAAFGGEIVRSCGMLECLERVRKAARWEEKRPRGRGIGIAAFTHVCAMLSTSAIVRILEDGSVNLNTGAVDLGQGSDTVLAQICADTLQVPLDAVNFAQLDTDGSPYNWTTGGSRTTYMAGRVIAQAADDARRKLFEHAAEMLECASGDLELRSGGRIGIAGVPGREVTFAAASHRAHWVAGGPIIGAATLMYEAPAFDPKRTSVTGNGIGRIGVYVFGAQAAEVEVDEVTGEVRVQKIWAAHDVGRAINPMAVRGQIVGGVAQGLGYALFEELAFDGGRPANPSLMDYRIPAAGDMPEVEAIIVEHPEPSHPYGAKGVGEPPVIGVAPAIANAIANACGARIRELPLTPERVISELSSASDLAKVR